MALGVGRLAEILIALAEDDVEIKRRLRLELAAQDGGDTIAAEVGRRLAALRSARSFVDWQQRRDFVKGLDLQRTMIVDRVAQTRADLALDLLWRFMDLAEPVLNRVDDSNGSVGDVFRAACQDLGVIAAKPKPDPVSLADRVYTAVQANDYGVFDGVVTVLLPALGAVGAARLKERLTKVLKDRPAGAGGRDHNALAPGFAGARRWPVGCRRLHRSGAPGTTAPAPPGCRNRTPSSYCWPGSGGACRPRTGKAEAERRQDRA